MDVSDVIQVICHLLVLLAHYFFELQYLFKTVKSSDFSNKEISIDTFSNTASKYQNTTNISMRC